MAVKSVGISQPSLQAQFDNMYAELVTAYADRETQRLLYFTDWRMRLEATLEALYNLSITNKDTAAYEFFSIYFADLQSKIPMAADFTSNSAVITLNGSVYKPPDWVIEPPEMLAKESDPTQPVYGGNFIAWNANPDVVYVTSYLMYVSQQTYANTPNAFQGMTQDALQTLAIPIVTNYLSPNQFNVSSFGSLSSLVIEGQRIYTFLWNLGKQIISYQNQINSIFGLTPGDLIVMPNLPQSFQVTNSSSVVTADPSEGFQLSDSDRAVIAAKLLQTNLFRKATLYVTIGDEPDSSTVPVVDVTTSMTPDQVSAINSLFVQLPRMYLKPWFAQSVAPAITDVSKQPILWGGFIDLFNRANSSYVTGQGLTPWVWEQLKLEKWQQTQSQDQLSALDASLGPALNMIPPDNPQTEAVLAAYALLPKLSDLGLEINRQNAINQLLIQGEYQTAQAIIDAYTYTNQYVAGISDTASASSATVTT